MTKICGKCEKFNANIIFVNQKRQMVNNETTIGWECSFCKNVNK